MSPPAWLPPLNSHDQKEISVQISQYSTDSLITVGLYPNQLTMHIEALVEFVSDNKHTTQKSLDGLSLWLVYTIPKSRIFPSEGNRPTSFIKELLSEVISFELEGDIEWSEKHLDQKEFSSYVLSQDNHDDGGDHQVFDEISKFVFDMDKKDYNIDNKRSLSFHLIIKKRVTIPDEELASWHSWFEEKTKTDARFSYKYRKAISRPRYEAELISESVTYRKRSIKPSMMEDLEREKAVESSSERCCSISMEEFLLESQVIKLPCSHTFDKECLRKWLRDSNTCPICRSIL